MSNKCCLCGGRIRDGRCVDCGMPLQEPSSRVISESDVSKKNRRTEKEFSVREQKETKSEDSKSKKKIKSDKKASKVSSYDYANGTNAGRAVKPQKKKNGCLIRFLSIGSVIALLAGPAISIVTEIFEDDTDSGYEYNDESNSDYDPYEYVEEELPEGEEYFSATLEPGFYEVGVQLPAGEYTVTALSGDGSFRLINKDLDLYVSEYLNSDPENEDSGDTEIQGLRCYEGSILVINSILEVKVETDTAVPNLITTGNLLTDDYNFTKDENEDVTTIIAGEDFPAGFYDFTTDQEYSSVSYKVNVDDYDWSYYFCIYDCDQTVNNILFPEGTEIEIQGHVILSPSEEIGEDWNEEFYDKIN